MNLALLYLLLVKATATSFSGLASLPVVRHDLVTTHHVLTDRQLSAAVAAGRTAPGPNGLYLVSVGGWPILLIGLICLLAGLTYSGGPWPFGYHGLGDLVCFICFGVLAVLGTAYLHRFEITPLDLWASIPVGCLVTAILIVNNLRDIDTDRQAGKMTLAV